METPPPHDQSERAVARFAREWNRAASPSSADFLAEFDRRFAESAGANVVEIAPRRARLAKWWFAAAAVLLTVVGVGGFQWHRTGPVGTIQYVQGGRMGTDSVLRRGSVLETGNENRTFASLDDERIGLFVSANSRVEITAPDRVVLVRGELWTVVRPNSGYFEVVTPHGLVEVHGTRFGVRTDSDGMDVQIAEGVVEVGVGDNCAEMRPGVQARVANGATNPTFSPASGDVTPEWARSLLVEAKENYVHRYFPSANPTGPPGQDE